MPRGGSRPGAGRPRGHVPLEEKKALKVLSAGKTKSVKFKTALDYAMSVINDDNADGDAKIRLAIAAMPFQSPKIEAVAAGGGKKGQQQAAAEEVGGKFGVRAAPKLAVDNTK